MSDALPVELMDLILDHLHPDQWQISWPNTAANKKDLAACSHVSRKWNAVTQSHLFQDVVYSFRRVPTDDETSREGEICQHEVYRRFSMGIECEARYKTLRLLCQFLRSNEMARASVRRLRLRVLPSARRVSMFASISHEDLCFDAQDRVEAEELATLLNLLPNLRGLHFIDVVPSAPLCASFKTTNLQQLSIEFGPPFYHLRDRSQHTTFSEYAAVQLLTFFGEVGDLRVSRVGFDHSSSYPDIPNAQPSSLRVRTLTLSMTQSNRGSLLEALVASTTLPDLHRLVVAPYDLSSREVQLLQSVLSLTQGHLLEFKYDLSRTNSFDAVVPVVDISNCTVLHRLVICFRIDPHARHVNIDGLYTIANFLSAARITQKTHPHLRAIVFEVTFLSALREGNDWQLRCFEATNAFDRAVTEVVSCHPALEVHFEYRTTRHSYSTPIDPGDAIERMMVGTSQRVKLHVKAYRSSGGTFEDGRVCAAAVDEFL